MQEDYKQQTKESYDFIADSYSKRDKEIIPETLEVNEAREKFISLLPMKSKVLDIGCGTGRDSGFFTKQGLKMIGIDFSENMINKAKEVNPEVNYQVMDFENIKFNNEEFDGVWANASLHHISKNNLPLVFKKIYQILKKGGLFFIKVKHGEKEGVEERKKFGKLTRRYFSYYQPQELKRLLEVVGFRDIEFNLTTKGEWLDILTKK